MSESSNIPPTASASPPTGTPRVPRHLIDAYFDHELDAPARLELFTLLRQDLPAAREMERTQRAIDTLRDEPATRDISAAVLDRLDHHAPARRTDWLARSLPVAVAAGLGLAIVLALALRQPAAQSPAPTPTPPIASNSTPTRPAQPAPRPSLAPAPATPAHQRLTPGALSVRPIGPSRDGDITLGTGSGRASVFTWDHFAQRNPFAAQIARRPGQFPLQPTALLPLERVQSLVPAARVLPAEEHPDSPR